MGRERRGGEEVGGEKRERQEMRQTAGEGMERGKRKRRKRRGEGKGSKGKGGNIQEKKRN